MDLSDEETPTVKRPVFRKKTPKGARAVKRVYEEDVEDPEKREKTVTAKSNARALEKIQRYRSLGKAASPSPVPLEASTEPSQGNPSEILAEPAAGLAYTVLPDPAKTFSLKESHFREKPVEVKQEYEREYDELSDDEKPALLSDSDPEMDVPNVEYTTVPLADPDQYFTEIVDDVEMEDAPRSERPALVSAYLAEIARITGEAKEQVEAAKRKQEVSARRLEAMEAKKTEVLREAESGSGLFGTVAAFIRSLYKQGGVVDVGAEKDDVDMMLLYV